MKPKDFLVLGIAGLWFGVFTNVHIVSFISIGVIGVAFWVGIQ